MKIVIEPEIMLRLQTIASAWSDEFSGFGFCELEKDTIRIYDFVLLNVGSFTFTEIPTSKILPIMERSDAGKCKAWIHRHPMGSGTPGPENWSGTDEATIKTGPLGSVPELVKWSVSVVLTPRGWVGRIDNYVTGKTAHLEVEPQATGAYKELAEIKSEVAAAAKPFRTYNGAYVSQAQTQGAIQTQGGRSEIEGLFDRLDKLVEQFQEILAATESTTQELEEVKDDLYTEVDNALLEINDEQEEIDPMQEEFNFGGV